MRVAVFAASTASAQTHVESARHLGAELARHDVGVVYGGGRVGLMGALADSALSAGGRVIGVLPKHLVDAEIAHSGLTRLDVVASMHERKERIAELADAFCALPGGAGTLEEWFEAWTWQQLGLHSKPVALLNADGFWQPLLNMLDGLVAQGYLRDTDRQAIVVVPKANHLLSALSAWEPPSPKWTDEGTPPVLETVAWANVDNGQLLAVRTRGQQVFYLPGGKIQPGEGHRAALRREVHEELGLDLAPASIRLLTVVDAPAHGRGKQRLRMHCYTAQAFGTATPGNEIDELSWLKDHADPRCAPALAKLLRYLGPDLHAATFDRL